MVCDPKMKWIVRYLRHRDALIAISFSINVLSRWDKVPNGNAN
mgnify:FL=1